MSLFVCLLVESMWHDSGRKGGEPFSLAGNKCTSLSLGPEPERPSLPRVKRENKRMLQLKSDGPHTQTETEPSAARGFGLEV